MSENVTILYVEDDPTSRKVMEMILKYQLKYTDFNIFADSQDFSARLNALPTPPKLVFLDIHVQPIDGFAMLEIIRQHADYQNTIVVALTASVMNEEVDKLEQSGFDGAIAKPLNKDAFPELVQRILRGEKVWHIT